MTCIKIIVKLSPRYLNTLKGGKEMKKVLVVVSVLLLLGSGFVIADSNQKNEKEKTEKPKITVVQNIAYEEGKLEVRVKGNKIQFVLDGEIFAKGTINNDGTFYIPIDNNKQTKIRYTKAYNKAIIKLTNQKQLK
ncbi:MAG: hypothetical protein ACOC1P_02570 [Minisyncoccales bacterium]